MKGMYYFTETSLPYLSFSAPPGLTSKEFLSMCEIELSPSDLFVLKSASLLPKHSEKPVLPILKNWFQWDQDIRNELVKLRAGKLGKDENAYIRGEASEEVSRVLVRDIFNTDSPLSAQDMLDQARWKYLEELERGHYFDVEKLIVYYLKLQLLERRNLYNKEEGQKKAEEILEKAKERLP